ncbi:hypothetical protein YPPY01_4653, partial [Yersinia pestis PY-01]
MRLATAFSAR